MHKCEHGCELNEAERFEIYNLTDCDGTKNIQSLCPKYPWPNLELIKDKLQDRSEYKGHVTISIKLEDPEDFEFCKKVRGTIFRDVDNLFEDLLKLGITLTSSYEV